MSRRRHNRRPDRHRYGSSNVVPRLNPDKPYESAGERHARRKHVNLDNRHVLENWCDETGWVFEVKNDGHHWIFKRPKELTGKKTVLVEWWPSSAKLVVDKQWDKGVHIHDYLQVRNFLRRQERKIQGADDNE